tara:strand:+ start:390 stop:497 length:108 start_codon:yes stop_codon:yes gene_type:complete
MAIDSGFDGIEAKGLEIDRFLISFFPILSVIVILY